MHQLLFWGCLLAVAITFPLVFGWIHFGSAPDDQMTYVTYLFGFPAGSFRIRTVVSWLLFTLSFTLLYQVSAVVMGLGGFCASGGPYVIETECPEALEQVPIDILPGLGLDARALGQSAGHRPALARRGPRGVGTRALPFGPQAVGGAPGETLQPPRHPAVRRYWPPRLPRSPPCWLWRFRRFR